MLPADSDRGFATIDKTDELRNVQDLWQTKQQSLAKDIELMRPWGDFDFKDVERLESAGYRLNFYVCPARDYRTSWEDDYQAIVVNNSGLNVYFVIVSRYDDLPDIEVEQARLPKESLAKLLERDAEATDCLHETQRELTMLTNTEMDSIKAALAETERNIDLSEVRLSGDRLAADKMLMLQGWVPEDGERALLAFLDGGGYFYEQETITPADDVPILLKNNAFTKLFEPITRMYALPNYTELDPTPLFAPFFMLFFGLCMGDGGYGLIIMGVCLALMKKVSPAMRGFLKLGAYMGGMTIVVGILTGCFFGISFDSVEWGWLKGVKDYFITEKNYAADLGGYNPLMLFAVVIGLVQIFFGMGVNAAKITKQFGIKYALSKIAWLVGLIAVGATVGMSAAGLSLGAFSYVLYGVIAICALVILLYNSPDKNVFMNVGSALWETYNMATGLLGDTLSYIRLFALGLTGGILGGVFNTLAFDLTSSLPAVAQFFAALLILLIGHSINFGLCVIASLVHPMRLTFVEFYKNAGFEGGGRTYKPFHV
jgi:V/A-type H+-transporting ATPase subunit I